jgi:hypothetical protein
MTTATTRRCRRLATLTTFSCLIAATSVHTNYLQIPQPAAIVEAMIRADYKGDRVALKTLHAQMPTASNTRAGEARLRYWKGFALWRRAINGMNQSADPPELVADLQGAVREFVRADELDHDLVDARVALISCYQLLTFVHRDDRDQAARWVEAFVSLLKDVSAVAPENPRLLWVQGQSEWYSPAGAPAEQVRLRQATAIATYKRGLEAARKARNAGGLEPAWGEPELLMNLAWAHQHGIDRDLAAARRYAEEALTLVPDWSYVRDMLLPQIAEPDIIAGADARRFVGRTATVCGPVASARYDRSIEGGPTFLNLDKPFPQQTLTVVIFAAQRSLFGEPEKRFAQKEICATGTIEELQQPPGVLRIVVRAANQIRQTPRR